MQEISQRTISGYLMLVIHFVILAATVIYGYYFAEQIETQGWYVVPLILGILLFSLISRGYFVVEPNGSKSVVLFGKYKGTVKEDGWHWANPFFKRIGVSLRACNLNSDKIKVNDKNGNPIIISTVVVWKVADTAKALFAVDNYQHYVDSQSEAAVRSLAGRYPYDNFEDPKGNVTLRNETEIVNEALVEELSKRLERAGIQILEARINHLAYAEEIASAMLRRQQASAVVAARRKIVEGAVGMVEMALDKISERKIVELDQERKAAMVSNLLVVLTGDQTVSPVVNTGTLHN